MNTKPTNELRVVFTEPVVHVWRALSIGGSGEMTWFCIRISCTIGLRSYSLLTSRAPRSPAVI